MQIYSPNQRWATTIQRYHTDKAHENCTECRQSESEKGEWGERKNRTDRNETQRHVQARLSGEKMLNVSEQMERTMRYGERSV